MEAMITGHDFITMRLICTKSNFLGQFNVIKGSY